MIEKLVLLCSKAIACDRTERGESQLRYVFDAALPPSVVSALLSLLPLNNVIQLEEDCPDNPVWEEYWQSFCEKLEKKHLAFRRKLKQLSKGSGRMQYHKIFFLNGYFKEVLDACSLKRNAGSHAKVPRMDCQYILQESLGNCKHDVSNEEMLSILAKHITELTLRPKNILSIQDLIKTDTSSLGNLNCLKLQDTCSQSYHGISVHDWIFCIRHALRNSHVRVLSTTTCCEILNEVVGISTKERDMEAKSSLWDEAVGSGSNLTGSEDDEVNSDLDIFGDEFDSVYHVSDMGIKELILSNCSKHAFRHCACKGLEVMYSLEKLTVASYSDEHFTGYFLNSIMKLLKSGLSHLRHIHLAGAEFFCSQQLANFFYEKERWVCLDDGSSEDEDTTVDEESSVYCLPDMEFLDTHVESLGVSGIGTQWQFSMARPPSLLTLFASLLSTCNPMHFWICWDERKLESYSPCFSMPDCTPLKNGCSIRLRKVTVIYQSMAMDHDYEQRPLVWILKALVAVLKSSAKDVDLCIHCDAGELSVSDFHHSFKSLELTLLRKPVSVNSIEDFVAQM